MGVRRPPTRYELWYGRDEPPPPQIALRAGPLDVTYDRWGLRHARAGDTEVVRRLYVAVRDEHWRTIPADVDALDVTDGGDHFAIRLEARNRAGGLAFRWRARFEGAPDGTLLAELDGIAETEFRYNRIGLCVHHAPNAAGRPYRARAPLGAVEGRLPLLLGRRELLDGKVLGLFPPFNELELELDCDVVLRFAFEGDLFEMEDQRNWTDGSFKTYSTPLALGVPHRMRSGDALRQRVVTTVRAPRRRRIRSPEPATLVVREALDRRLPLLGLGAGAAPGEASAQLLRALAPDHLRVELHADAPDRLEAAARDAVSFGAALEVVVFLSDDAEPELGGLQLPADARIARVVVLRADGQTSDARLAGLVRDRFGAVPIACGTSAHFADLNRDRPNTAGVDAVAYAIAPQVHAVDEVSIVEAAAPQGDTVRSARAYFPGKDVVVGPVTLLPRVADATDPRQRTLFAAAWAVASARALAESGPDSVTYFETTGARGVIDDGRPFPVYHVLRDLMEARGSRPVPVTSSAPLEFDGIALAGRGRLRVLVAGLVPETQQVVVAGLPERVASVRRLNEATAEAAAADAAGYRATFEEHAVRGGRLRLELAPFEIARMDVPT